MSSAADYASDGTTLVEVIAGYEDDGYVGQFAAVEGAAIRCFSCRATFAAGEACIDAMRRTEGASDPADMAVVAAVTCPRCDVKGTLLLKYGPEAGPEDDDVLRLLEDHRSANGGDATGGVGGGVGSTELGGDLGEKAPQ